MNDRGNMIITLQSIVIYKVSDMVVAGMVKKTSDKMITE